MARACQTGGHEPHVPVAHDVSVLADLDSALPTDVVLEVPAAASSLRVVRMVAATIVADDGFDIDEVDDVRMAVDELSAAMIESAPTSPLRVRFRPGADRLDVRIDADTSTPAAAPIDELRAAVLGAVADEYDTTVDGRAQHRRFAKRSKVAAPGDGRTGMGVEAPAHLGRPKASWNVSPRTWRAATSANATRCSPTYDWVATHGGPPLPGPWRAERRSRAGGPTRPDQSDRTLRPRSGCGVSRRTAWRRRSASCAATSATRPGGCTPLEPPRTCSPGSPVRPRPPPMSSGGRRPSPSWPNVSAASPDAVISLRSTPPPPTGRRRSTRPGPPTSVGRATAWHRVTSPFEDRVAVRELLARLPERERRIVELRFDQGLTQDEIAQDRRHQPDARVTAAAGRARHVAAHHRVGPGGGRLTMRTVGRPRRTGWTLASALATFGCNSARAGTGDPMTMRSSPCAAPAGVTTSAPRAVGRSSSGTCCTEWRLTSDRHGAAADERGRDQRRGPRRHGQQLCVERAGSEDPGHRPVDSGEGVARRVGRLAAASQAVMGSRSWIRWPTNWGSRRVDGLHEVWFDLDNRTDLPSDSSVTAPGAYVSTTPPELSITHDVVDERLVVSVAGDLDLGSAPELEPTVAALAPFGHTVVIDLSGRRLHRLQRRAFVARGQPVGHGRWRRSGELTGSSSSTRRLIELTGIDQVFTVD